jgi:hypothetical protein
VNKGVRKEFLLLNIETKCVKTRKLIKAFLLHAISSKGGSDFNIMFAKPRRQDYIKCGNRI